MNFTITVSKLHVCSLHPLLLGYILCCVLMQKMFLYLVQSKLNWCKKGCVESENSQIF